MHVFPGDQERRATTSDWLVLAAGILVLGIVVYSVIGDSQSELLKAFHNASAADQAARQQGSQDLAEGTPTR